MALAEGEIAGIVVGAIALFALLIWLIRWIAQGRQYNDKTIRIDGKVVIVTGCNTGIGKETALELARRGAKVYMACRDFQRCEEARKDIIKQTGNENVINKTLDLASLESIRKFVREFNDEETRLDILINNAGLMTSSRRETKDGFELHIGTNHMGHFLLTNLLLDRLIKSAPSRIIVVSSSLHEVGKINRNDLNMEKNYNRFSAYANSKLANNLFTRELSKRLYGTSVVANSVHPGFVKTEAHRDQGLFNLFFYPTKHLFAKSSKQGAQTTIFAALDPLMGKISGNYYANCKLSNESAASRNDDDADWLWKTSEEWTGLKTEE